MNPSIPSILSCLPRGRRLGRAIHHRWPSLAVATVAVALPASVALAATAAGPTDFTSNGLEPAVFAHNQGSGVAIEALADNNIALRAGSGAASSFDAIQATAGGSGAGVRAKSTSGSAVVAQANTKAGTFAAGVRAIGDEGVVARGTTIGLDVTATGPAINAASSNGVGGDFSGAVAPIRLDPAATPGAPQSGTHHKGELYVDSNGQLFLCIADSINGTAGTWKQVVLK